MRFARVKITTDVAKLWECEGMRCLSPDSSGKLPDSAGLEIRVIVPPVGNTFCQSAHAWNVIKEDWAKDSKGQQVCEHQIDVTDACFDVRLEEK